MIVINLKIEDDDLRNAVKDAVKGEIVSLTRSALEEIISQSVSDKLKIHINDTRFMSILDREVKEFIKRELHSQIWVDRDKLNPKISDIIKNEIRNIIKDYLKTII